MRFRPLALLALLASTATAASAQQTGPGPGGPGQRPMMMNPIAFDGPPAPATFAPIVGLTAAQTPKYAALRKSYMTSTQAERDSLRAMRAELRARMRSGGDRDAAGPGMEAMRKLGTAINDRYEEFEAELQFLLTAPQQAKFAAWKEAERARMMEERRSRMGSGAARGG